MSQEYRKDLDFKVDTIKKALEALLDKWFETETLAPSYIVITKEALNYARMEHLHNMNSPLVQHFGKAWTIMGIEITVLNNSHVRQQNYMELVK